MTALIGDHDPRSRQQALEGERLRAYETFREAVDAARRNLDETTRRIDQETAELRRATGDLRVLLRWRPGPAVTVYHSATHPCGRVTGKHRDRDSFRETNEASARLRGLQRCTACNWRQAERPPRRG